MYHLYASFVGNREKLLAGAKRCLVERGYARTTARDVAAASGANLGSIGYHFGSMEALLTAALIEGLEEWSESFERVLAAEPAQDLETTWRRIIESFDAGRPMLLASFEALPQSEHLPEVRARLAAAYEDARLGLAAIFLGPDAVPTPETARAVGSLCLAIMSGVMAQWLIDPERAPSGRDVALALRTFGGTSSPDTAACDTWGKAS